MSDLVIAFEANLSKPLYLDNARLHHRPTRSLSGSKLSQLMNSAVQDHIVKSIQSLGFCDERCGTDVRAVRIAKAVII